LVNLAHKTQIKDFDLDTGNKDVVECSILMCVLTYDLPQQT